MDILQLDQELRANKLRPVYLIIGEEGHLAVAARQRILRALFPEGRPALDRFSLKQAPLDQALDTWLTPPMWTPRRVVVLEEADGLKKGDWERLQKVLQTPPPKGVLILLAAKMTAGVKKLPDTAGLVECKRLYPRQIAGWINMAAHDLGVSISREAAAFLLDCVGTDLGNLQQTLEKLLLFVGNRRLIQVEDVETVAARTAQKSLFDLTNAIGVKQSAEAMRLLHTILDQGEEPLKVLALIARHCRLLVQAQDVLQTSPGAGPADFAKRLGVHPFFAKDYASQARDWPVRGWKKCFAALAVCDRRLKSSRHAPQAILERLIVELCATTKC